MPGFQSGILENQEHNRRGGVRRRDVDGCATSLPLFLVAFGRGLTSNSSLRQIVGPVDVCRSETARHLLLCFIGLWLGNCAGTILTDPARSSLQTYIGHPVSELVSRFGPPKASVGIGGGKMAFQWDQSVLGQSLAATQNAECRLDTIIAIARPTRAGAAPSELQAWNIEGWKFGGAECV
jgi:hypothetical protein